VVLNARKTTVLVPTTEELLVVFPDELTVLVARIASLNPLVDEMQSGNTTPHQGE